MIQTNIPEINVDELMEKIRAEVRRRKEREETVHGPAHQADRASQPAPSPGIDPFSIGTIPEPEPFEFKGGGYHINDFLKYHDLHFVMNAYRGILRRRPDSEGLQHFLKNFRSGKMSKAEVLGRLRYSPEGRVKKVKMKGLFWNFVVQSSFRIPVLGYFSRLTVGIVNLPVIIRNLNTLEANTFAQLQAQHNHINTLADTAQFKINEVIDKQGQVGALLDQKADRDELAELNEKKVGREELIELNEAKADVKDLMALNDKKADRDELGQLKEEVEGVLEQKADKEQIEPIKNEISEILRQTRDNKLNILDQQRRLVLLLEKARKRLPEPISTDQIKKMLTEEDHLPDAMYVSFEDQFRGTREDIKERQAVYLPYITNSNAGTITYPLLDIGCGRGEWLELLKENGFVAKGIDINNVMVRECKDRGLDVWAGNAGELLKKQEDNSVGGITAFHVVEHLSVKVLIALFDEAFRVLKPGGIIIIETPNPENVLVGSCIFYNDLTHKKPIPPNTLMFLIESRGFIAPEIVRLHPLHYVEYDKDDALKDLVYRFNMGQDYAVIARKAS